MSTADNFMRVLINTPQNVRDKTIYRLCGEDVICQLDSKDLLQQMTTGQIARMIDMVERRLTIPWTEYVDAAIDAVLLSKDWEK